MKRGKKGKKIVTDLQSFTAAQETSEKDIYHKPAQQDKPRAPTQPVVEINRSEEEVNKYVPGDLSVPAMYYPLDNKLLDAYFGGKQDVFTEEERDLL